jgi:predicted Zn-dependent protease
MDSMGGTQALNDEASVSAPTASGSCPCCDEPWGGLPHAQTRAFPEIALRRCRRCGGRFAAENGHARLLVSCTTCSLPFLSDDRENPTEQRCEDCIGGRVPIDLPDAQLISAAEQEVRDALDEVWGFAHSPTLSAYLNRLARILAAEIDGAPQTPQVALLDDLSVRTLALPSGLVILSIGALASVEDEAELAFLLAHELVHSAHGDAALRLVRQGLINIARQQDAVSEVWRSAVDDMLALGYGRKREFIADDQAFATMLELGFDPDSVLRWLVRLDGRVSDADAHIRTFFLSHPTPCQRHQRFKQKLASLIEPPGSRVNREVFRRAAGREVLASALVRVDSLAQACDVQEESAESAAPRPSSLLLWAGLGVALTVTIVLLVLALG